MNVREVRQGEWRAVPCYSACRSRESGDRIRRLIPAAYSGGLLRRSNRAEATGCGNPSGKVDPPPRAVHDAVRQVDQQHNMGRLLRFFEIGKGRTSNSLPDLKVRRLRGKRLSILVISAPELLQAE
ncbi:hypothetical protein ACX84T_08860 [Burkholderia pseudomallei]|nr:hypothetical protein [Burkholderia pseudomallei]MBF4128764.1 hypothetical protein [Burkholderia pseudomallei]